MFTNDHTSYHNIYTHQEPIQEDVASGAKASHILFESLGKFSSEKMIKSGGSRQSSDTFPLLKQMKYFTWLELQKSWCF